MRWLTDAACREACYQRFLQAFALLSVGNKNATKPETRLQTAGHALLDGSTAITGLLFMSFPVALSGLWFETRMAGILHSHQRTAQISAKDAFVLGVSVVILEPTHEVSVAPRVIADSDDSALGRMRAVLALLVEEVKAIGDRDIPWPFEQWEWAQQLMHGRADFLRFHGDLDIHSTIWINVRRCRITLEATRRGLRLTGISCSGSVPAEVSCSGMPHDRIHKPRHIASTVIPDW